jgi:hypothetical protein
LSLLLLAGGVLVFVSVGPHWPKERKIEFRFDSDVGSIVRLDVTWTRVEGSVENEDVALASSFRFEAGSAPKIVRTNVRLPDGTYALDITVERVDRSESLERSLTLGDTDEITVPLR